jgi:hypothetical protein
MPKSQHTPRVAAGDGGHSRLRDKQRSNHRRMYTRPGFALCCSTADGALLRACAGLAACFGRVAFGSDEALPAPHHRYVSHLRHAPLRNAAVSRHHKRLLHSYSKRHASRRYTGRNHMVRWQASMPSASLTAERPLVSLYSDLAALKQAIELVRQHKPRQATALAASVGDQ